MTVRDTPIIIPTACGSAFGVLTRPDTPSALAAVVLPGNEFANAGPFIHVLSRALAAAGIPALRLDYLDFGESTGGVAKLRADQPRDLEVLAAVAALRDRGYSHFILVGFCYGAAVGLAAAPRVKGLAGVVLLSHPTIPRYVPGADWTRRQLLARVARPRSWRNLLSRASRRRYTLVLQQFSAGHRGARARTSTAPDRGSLVHALTTGLQRLRSRRIPAFVLYGEHDMAFEHLRATYATDATVNALLAGAPPLTDTVILPGSVHLLRGEAVAESTIAEVLDWMQPLLPESSQARSAPLVSGSIAP